MKKENHQTEETTNNQANSIEEVTKDCACDKNQSTNKEMLLLQDKLARTTADFDNFQKRSEKEKLGFIQFLKIDLIGQMIPFLDEIEMAMQASEKLDSTGSEWIKGFDLIKNNMQKTFDKMGVKEIECAGKFDPNKHEALVQVEQKDLPSETIVDVLRKGYRLEDKVIRHAQVSVAK